VDDTYLSADAKAKIISRMFDLDPEEEKKVLDEIKKAATQPTLPAPAPATVPAG